MMNPIRIAPGMLLAALIAGPAWSQEQSAPPATDAQPAVNHSKPKLIHIVRPVYPKDAKEARISGKVRLRAVISDDGSVQQVEYLSGPEELRQAAIDAVQQWKYEPTTVAGRPVTVDTTIDIVFRLEERAPTQPPQDQAPTPHDVPADSNNPTPAVAPGGVVQAVEAPPPPPVTRGMRIRIGGSVAAANLTHRVVPVYPDAAKAAHISGKVMLHIVIAVDGTVQQVDYVSGPDELKDAAIDAVKQWKYRPTLLNHEPVEVDTTVMVVFSLD